MLDYDNVNFQVGTTPSDGTPGFVKCEKPDCEMCQFVVPQLAIKSTVTGDHHYGCFQASNQMYLLVSLKICSINRKYSFAS